MKATLMQTMSSRRRRSSTQGHTETSEAVDGGEDAAVMDRVTAGEAMANANTTRTHKEQLNKEPLRVVMYKALHHHRRLPAPQDRTMSNNRNYHM